MKHIKEGDIVTVLANDDESELWGLVHHPASRKYARKQFSVLYIPSDVGDMWYLEEVVTKAEIAINSNSTNVDGFVKVKSPGTSS